jgi:hypothetical protein
MGIIKYYPSTRIKANLYTRGTEFRLPDGTPYSGRYYTTFEGDSYVGSDPFTGTNELLIPVQATPTNVRTAAVRGNNVLTQVPEAEALPGITELGQLTPYYPVPLESDYARGYFTRYFAKQLTGPGFILEISQNTWSTFRNGLTSQGLLAYEVTSMLWQLTGPRNDVRVSQYQVKGGVESTNKRVTIAKEPTFRGIISYIGEDYTKFARITP